MQIVERLRLKRDEAAALRAITALRAHREDARAAAGEAIGVVLLLDRYPAAAVAAFAAATAGRSRARSRFDTCASGGA